MRSRELQIGDWVYFGKDEYSPSKIDGILPYDEGVVLDFDNEPISNDHIRPIPLTAAILEKNGFKDGGVLSYEFYDGYHVFLEAEKRSVHAGALWYVHELQRALRLCGMNELADNFKI